MDVKMHFLPSTPYGSVAWSLAHGLCLGILVSLAYSWYLHVVQLGGLGAPAIWLGWPGRGAQAALV